MYNHQESAKAWVEAFEEGWRAPIDADHFADHFEPWLHPEVRFVQPLLPTIVGHRAFREQFARPLFELLPDLRGRVEDWAVRGETVYVELWLKGTVGRRPVTMRTCDRVTLHGGRAIERVGHFDPTAMLAAIALAPRVWPQVLRQRRLVQFPHRRVRRSA